MSGNISYRNLAKKHGVPFGTLRKVAAKEQWTLLRTQTRSKADTKIVEVVSEKKANIDTKYFDLIDKLFDKASEVIEQTPSWNVVTLKEMASAMKYLKECKGVKSEADMREQEARIAKLQKEAEEEVKENNEIKVIIEGSLEKYSE